MTLNGRNLLQYIVQAIAWAAPRSYLKSFTDIIGALNSHCITLLSQWLEVSLLVIAISFRVCHKMASGTCTPESFSLYLTFL